MLRSRDQRTIKTVGVIGELDVTGAGKGNRDQGVWSEGFGGTMMKEEIGHIRNGRKEANNTKDGESKGTDRKRGTQRGRIEKGE